MRIYYKSEEKEKLDFAELAGKHFAENPKHTSFATSGIEKDTWVALRWNTERKSVLIFKTSDVEDVVIYPEVIESK